MHIHNPDGQAGNVGTTGRKYRFTVNAEAFDTLALQPQVSPPSCVRTI
jgi:hypothetical protein